MIGKRLREKKRRGMYMRSSDTLPKWGGARSSYISKLCAIVSKKYSKGVNYESSEN